MSLIAPAYVTLNPSHTMPGILLPYTQASGAFDLLPNGEPVVQLGEGDQVVYMNRADVRTKMAAGQSAYNELPSVSIAMSQISTATYLMRVRAEYDHHDTAAAGRRGISLVQAQRLGMQQAHVQFGRTGLLYGFNPANGEGLVNTNGATAINLPPDSNGNDTAVTYDNGQMGLFLMQLVASIKSRTNQLGIGRKFVYVGPQRIMSLFEYNVVQVTQFQRPGAGTEATKGMLNAVLMANGDEMIWAYDDTLIGKGAGGNDLVIVGMPEVENPHQDANWDTNRFATLEPGIDACTMQLTDMIAPREIPTPLPGGAIDVLSEMRMTSGWGIRPEALTLLSIQYQ